MFKIAYETSPSPESVFFKLGFGLAYVCCSITLCVKSGVFIEVSEFSKTSVIVSKKMGTLQH